MAQSFTYNDINALYNKNLGRSASQDEFQGWSSGAYGGDPYSQIPQSGEAQAYSANQPNQAAPINTAMPKPAYQTAPDSGVNKGPLGWAPAPGTSPSGTASTNQASQGGAIDWSGRSNQDAQILNQIAQWSQAPGSNPSLKNDPNYWLGRIKETGGLGSDNAAYWQGLGMRPEGAPEGGSAQSGQWVSSGPSAGGQGGGWQNIQGGQGNTLFDMLMKRANQSLNIDPNDPVMKQQSDTYNAQNERARRTYLSEAAEKGGPNANLTAETRASEEKVGQLGGQFEGQLMQNELNARRQEIQSALSGAAGFLTQEQQLQLQQEMDMLNRQQSAYQFDINDQFRNSPLGS